MADFKPCQFFVLRYVPDIVEDVRVPIGIVLLEEAEEGFTGIRFARTWERVRQVDPGVDIELLRGYEAELQRLLQSRLPEVINYRAPSSRRDWLLNEMQRSFSGAIQFEPEFAVRTESPADELAFLAKAYLDKAIRSGGERRVSGRRSVYNAMRDAFDAAGVWSVMWRDIEVAKYGDNGDPLKIDCAYKLGQNIHMFHAVSLAADVNAAKALAFSYENFRKPMRESEGLEPNLFAVVEDGLDRADATVAFALDALDRYGIDVAPVAQMPAIAERAREELKL